MDTRIKLTSVTVEHPDGGWVVIAVRGGLYVGETHTERAWLGEAEPVTSLASDALASLDAGSTCGGSL